jgi:steroid 5-alpha reductase family enzyme
MSMVSAMAWTTRLPLVVLAGWLAAAALMTGLWLIQRRTRNAGIVDVAWSFATGSLGAVFALAADGAWPRRLVVAILAAAWGVRLGVHLWTRVAREAEDGRYRQMRADWGPAADRHLLVFFQIQALWAVLFALPMLAAAGNAAPWSAWDALGVLLWLIGLAGETIADRQLAAFRAAPGNRGRVCQVGLWRYSRHPNYFFEWLHWWGYAALGLHAPLWWLPLAAVVAMGYFITRVTGIPPTEAQAVRSRGEAYRTYQRTTSAFVPWPPRAETLSEARR